MPSIDNLVLAAVASAGMLDEPQIHWAESYESAFEEANDRGVPLCLIVIQDREEANDDVWANTILSEDFVEATRYTVNVIGNRGKEEEHGTTLVGEGRAARKICRKFGEVTCLQHNKMEVGIFRDFAKAGEIRTPLILIVLPDQTVVAQFVDRNPLSSILSAFEKARKLMPDGLSWDETRELREKLGHAEEWLANGEVERVLEFAEPLSERKSKSRLIAEAVGLLHRVEDMGTRELKEVDELVASGSFVEAMTRLEDVARRYRGSAIEKVAKQTRGRLARDKEVKKALAAHKREARARELLEKADRLKAEGKEKNAQRIYDSILVNYSDTKAAEELRSRVDDPPDRSPPAARS